MKSNSDIDLEQNDEYSFLPKMPEPIDDNIDYSDIEEK